MYIIKSHIMFCFFLIQSRYPEVLGSGLHYSSYPPCWSVPEQAHLISRNQLFSSYCFALGLARKYTSSQGMSKKGRSRILSATCNRSCWKFSKNLQHRNLNRLLTQYQNTTWDLPAPTPLHHPERSSLSHCKQLSLLTTNEHQQRSPGFSEP